jgi:hypothetical protein
MAFETGSLPIITWPGTSSFSPGMTPFGYFDSDPIFQTHADKVATWVATRLGYPTTDVELTDVQIYTCFEEAVLEYSNQVNQFAIIDNLFNLQGSTISGSLTGKPVNPTLGRIVEIARNYGTEAGAGGYVSLRTASIEVKQGVSVYDLKDFLYETSDDVYSDIEVKKVMHHVAPAVTRFFDPFAGSGIGNQNLLDSFGWGGYSAPIQFMMLPLWQDLLRVQQIEFNDIIRRSAFSFDLTGDRLRLFPIPNRDFRLYIHYINKKDRDLRNQELVNTENIIGDYSNAPFGLHEYRAINTPGYQWIFKYTLALAKELLGNIRGKYATVQYGNTETTLNGSELISQADTEKTTLIEQLRENLQATGRTAQIEKISQEAENLQSKLNKIPLPFYFA